MKVDPTLIVLESLGYIFRAMIAAGIAWEYSTGAHVIAGGMFIFFLFEHLHEIRQEIKQR